MIYSITSSLQSQEWNNKYEKNINNNNNLIEINAKTVYTNTRALSIAALTIISPTIPYTTAVSLIKTSLLSLLKQSIDEYANQQMEDECITLKIKI